MVGRPREFDTEQALDAAMQAFWAKGYEATSLADLMDATGLHKGSLYQAFGDKHSLFMSALTHYADKEFHETKAVIDESKSPLENIRAIVNKICGEAGSEQGCLVINSIVELAPHDAEVAQAIRSFGELRLEVMSEMIGAAKDAGEISDGREPMQLARQLMMTLAGAAAMVKGFVTQEEITVTLNELIDSWV